MKTDWMARFLPFWALGTVAWIWTGFVLAPDAYRLSLFRDNGSIWQTGRYDTLELDWHVARLLGVIIGPPMLFFLAALVLGIIHGRREARKNYDKLYK